MWSKPLFSQCAIAPTPELHDNGFPTQMRTDKWSRLLLSTTASHRWAKTLPRATALVPLAMCCSPTSHTLVLTFAAGEATTICCGYQPFMVPLRPLLGVVVPCRLCLRLVPSIVYQDFNLSYVWATSMTYGLWAML
ncbi:hypothetical protein L6452_18519 [Arctium lappa]|uniref:Uncharacterized protein n=1 Tax=Arctium lappa TaxID=4217 RepID=A0ACB9C6E6_ARCLA|nr:hypothetical protein L6452_18519 [Arctium lappa]